MKHPIIEQLRRERRIRELTQDALALAMEKNQQSICHFESGRNFPRLDTLDSWASALGYELTLTPKAKS